MNASLSYNWRSKTTPPPIKLTALQESAETGGGVSSETKMPKHEWVPLGVGGGNKVSGTRMFILSETGENGKR